MPADSFRLALIEMTRAERARSLLMLALHLHEIGWRHRGRNGQTWTAAMRAARGQTTRERSCRNSSA